MADNYKRLSHSAEEIDEAIINVDQAKENSSGVFFETLKARLDGDVNLLHDGLKDDLDKSNGVILQGTVIIPNKANIIRAFITDDGRIGQSINDLCYVVYVECEPNTIYHISKSSSNAFKVSYSTVKPALEVMTSNMVKPSSNSVYYVTGDEAKYLCIYYTFNDEDADSIFKSIIVTTNGITAKDEVSRKRIFSVCNAVGNEIIDFLPNTYINTGTEVINTVQLPANDGYSSAVVNCEGGDIFTITGEGGGILAKLWCFIDENGNALKSSYSNITQTDYVIVAPSEAKKLIINSKSENTYAVKNIRLLQKYNELNDLVTNFVNNEARFYSLIDHYATGTEEKNGMTAVSSNGEVTINGKATADTLLSTCLHKCNGGLYYVTGMNEFNPEIFIQIYNLTNNTEIVVKDKRGVILSVGKDEQVRVSIFAKNSSTANNLIISPKMYNLQKRIGSDSDIIESKPTSYPQGVALKKSQQWINLKWTPKGEIPKQGGDEYFTANEERTGMLYGEGVYQGKNVGIDVSLLTFMTAINNPYSLMYTENTNENNSKSAYGITYYGDYNSGAYMGMPCNAFVNNVLGNPIPFSSYQIDGGQALDEHVVDKVYDQSANGVELCDILSKQGHVRLVTGVWRDNNYKTTEIQISESVGTGVRSLKYTAESFNDMLLTDDYRIYRYNDLYKNINYYQSPFVTLPDEVPLTYEYNNDICTFAGDYAAFSEGDLIHINYEKGIYTSMEIYKNDTLIETITIDDGHDVDLTNKGYTYGKYKARLTNGTDESEYTHWEIIDLSIVLNGEELTYTTNNGNPVYWSWADYRGWQYHKHSLIGSPKSKTINIGSKPDTEYKYLRVYVEGDYGRINKKIEVTD